MVSSGSKVWRSSPFSFPNAETLCRLQSYRSSTKLLAGISLQGIQMVGQFLLERAVKELSIGAILVSLSITWKRLYDWNEERKVRRVYDGLLEKGEIYEDMLRKGLVSVVAEEGEYKIPVHIMNSDRDYADSWSLQQESKKFRVKS